MRLCIAGFSTFYYGIAILCIHSISVEPFSIMISPCFDFSILSKCPFFYLFFFYYFGLLFINAIHFFVSAHFSRSHSSCVCLDLFLRFLFLYYIFFCISWCLFCIGSKISNVLHSIALSFIFLCMTMLINIGLPKKSVRLLRTFD